jgi:hypothetical protein
MAGDAVHLYEMWELRGPDRGEDVSGYEHYLEDMERLWAFTPG